MVDSVAWWLVMQFCFSRQITDFKPSKELRVAASSGDLYWYFSNFPVTKFLLSIQSILQAKLKRDCQIKSKRYCSTQMESCAGCSHVVNQACTDYVTNISTITVIYTHTTVSVYTVIKICTTIDMCTTTFDISCQRSASTNVNS